MNWNASWDAGWNAGWQGEAETGTAITNTGATQPTGNSYNTCQLSGYRAKPGELVERWDGLLVLPRFSEPRNEQDFVRVHAEKLSGSIRPEAIDNFITTSVTAESL